MSCEVEHCEARHAECDDYRGMGCSTDWDPDYDVETMEEPPLSPEIDALLEAVFGGELGPKTAENAEIGVDSARKQG